MHSVFRLSTLVVASLALTSLRAGDISGRALDAATKTYLAGAAVQLDGTARTAVTDAEGRFRFLHVPAGTYTVSGTFSGRNSASARLAVPATGDAIVELAFGSEVVSLGKFVVEGYREGRARALQQKRTSDNLVDLVSADSVGNLPDRNVAEAIGRLPGVSLSLDQGEGQYVSIRGIEPNLNQVTVDGATMAAPGGSRLGRAVPLDVLSASQISQLEVIKTVTPDLDANSLGGTLNIKTASAFDRKERFLGATAALNVNEIRGKTGYAYSASFGDTFGRDRQFGLALSATFDTRSYQNDKIQTNWSTATFSGQPIFLPTGFEIHPETGDVQRNGVTLNFEYRPATDLQFFLRSNFTRGLRWTEREEILYSVDVTRVALTSATTGTFDASRTRLERRAFRTREDKNLFNVSTGVKKIFGPLTVEPVATFSRAKNTTPFQESVQFRGANGDPGAIQFDVTDFSYWTWTPGAGAADPAKFPLRRTREDSAGGITEDTATAKVDVRYDSAQLLFGRPGYLKAGAKYISRDRDSNLPSYRLVPVGNWTLANIGVLPGRTDVYNGKYATGFSFDWAKTWAYIRGNPTLTTYDPADSLSNSIQDTYKINEDIYAGYALASLRLAPRLTLLGGFRWERTESAIRAYEYRTQGTAVLGIFPQQGSTTYDNVLPNLQLIYTPANSLVLRAAVTNTIGRPAYEDARPYSIFTYQALGASASLDPAFPNAGTLTIGNPALKPFNSLNTDLSAELYTAHGGLLSVALYRKEIDDPIYTFTETQRKVDHSGVALETLNVSSVRNADTGRISGLEFNLYKPFRFLPSPFDGFGVDANVTFVRSSVVIPLRRTEKLPFFRQPQHIGNVTLFYEKAGFSARVAYRYEGEQLYTLGSTALNDIFRRARATVDAQVRYRFTRQLSATAAVRNLARAREDFTYGPGYLLRTSRTLGRDYSLTLNLNF